MLKRPFFFLLLTFLLVLLGPERAAFASLPEAHSFTLLRDGAPIGSHTIAFSRDGEDLIVKIDIRIDVKVLGITFFRYRHENREVWRNDRLVSIRTRTDDDGTRMGIDGRQEDGRFVVTTIAGERHVYPADVVPTSYWNPRTRLQSVLLNSQDGAPLRVTVTPDGREAVASDRGNIPDARKFVVAGELNLNLWYDDRDRLVKLNFYPPNDKTLIDYLVIEPDRR